MEKVINSILYSLGAISTALAVLKLTSVISLTWYWVLSPLWILPALTTAGLTMIGIWLCANGMINKLRGR